MQRSDQIDDYYTTVLPLLANHRHKHNVCSISTLHKQVTNTVVLRYVLRCTTLRITLRTAESNYNNLNYNIKQQNINNIDT